MTKRQLQMIIVSLVWAISIMSLCPPAQGAEDNEQPIQHIYLISVNGLNYEAYKSAYLPNMRDLAMQGAVYEKALAVPADTVEAGEATLLTGALPEEHKHYTANDRVEVESIFDVLKKNGRSVLVVDGSGGKLQSFAHGKSEYRKVPLKDSSAEVFHSASSAILQHKPLFSYIYVDDCNAEQFKYDEDLYYQSLKKFDTQLGAFIHQLREHDLLSHSVIIVTSARSSSISNLVPLILYAPSVKANTSLSGGMIIDVIPTVSRMLKIDTPVSARGFPLYGAFLPGEEEEPLEGQWIKALETDRLQNWLMNYKLEQDLTHTVNQMNAIKEERQSIFNFAGEREQTIAGLKARMTLERLGWCALVALMLLGYLVEFLWLKKRYLLFK